MSAVDGLLEGIKIPRMFKIEQHFDRTVIEDVEAVLTEKLYKSGVLSRVKPGQTVAITAGSRGLSNLPLMIKVLVREIRKAGGQPFIFPAMGSHGGATAEGQKKMLSNMGITEEYTGAPIRATMEVVQVGTTDRGFPVYIDKYAYEADAIVLINSIKPHVAFRGKYESGLMKMITIGMGKQKGADKCHELGFGLMAENIPSMAKVTLAKTNIIFGVAVLDNAYHETSRIEVIRSEDIEAVEPGLQEESKRLRPRIHFDSLDVLIIDEIGKDISGTGFDTNTVGRYHTPYASGGPSITRISCLDITDKSDGNGNGIGLLDFTTMRAFKKFSFEKTYPNCLTATVPTTIKIPMVLKNDRQAIQAAIKTCNIPNKEAVRLVRIKNTLQLGEIEVSENLLEEVKGNKYLRIVEGPYELPFDEDGNLF